MVQEAQDASQNAENEGTPIMAMLFEHTFTKDSSQSLIHTYIDTYTHTHTWTLGGVASCMLHSYGVLGLAPCHFTCRNTCRYRWLIRPPFPHLGIASLAQVSKTGLCPLHCFTIRNSLLSEGYTRSTTPFSGVVVWFLIRRQTVLTVQTRTEH